MPEIRQNLISRQWVIYSTERAKRPDQFRQTKEAARKLPRFNPHCPFCPGNEEKTPPESFRVPRDGNWQVRVVPNKFAALSAEGELVRTQDGMKRTLTGVGIHEVIVESPRHDTTLALMDDANVGQVIGTYLERYHKVLADPRVEQVTLFKNHGEGAGTSLEHPHSQLIGTPVIPSEVRERLETALQFYDDNGKCIFCAMLEQELADGVRIVAENDHFVAFVPFAALSPFSLWIYPRRHCASFGCMESGEIPGLGHILRVVLRKLYDGLDNPDYNLVIRTAPKESEQVRYYHWYMSLVPRLTRLAGFEMGSGMFINVTLPEPSAEYLRGVQVE